MESGQADPPAGDRHHELQRGVREPAALIAFAWFADAHTSLVLSSGAVAVYTAGVLATRARQFLSTDAFHTRSGQLLFVLGPLACLLFAANAIAVASLAVYAVALCIQLSVAVISFYSVVAAASG